MGTPSVVSFRVRIGPHKFRYMTVFYNYWDGDLGYVGLQLARFMKGNMAWLEDQPRNFGDVVASYIALKKQGRGWSRIIRASERQHQGAAYEYYVTYNPEEFKELPVITIQFSGRIKGDSDDGNEHDITKELTLDEFEAICTRERGEEGPEINLVPKLDPDCHSLQEILQFKRQIDFILETCVDGQGNDKRQRARTPLRKRQRTDSDPCA